MRVTNFVAKSTAVLLLWLLLAPMVARAVDALPLERASVVDSSAPPPAAAAEESLPSVKALAGPGTRNPRVLFITSKDTATSAQELERLNRTGGDFEKLRASGWTIGAGPENLVQIIDREDVADLVKKMHVKEYPTVACIENGEIVRYFRTGCTTPLDVWTLGFLAKGIDERPPGMVPEEARVESTGSYPLRGNHWSVEGDWNPTRERVIEHLHGPNHASQLLASWHIENWSLEELRSLHDDLHEKYDTGGGYSAPADNQAPSYLKAKGLR